jgi:hypothetical protein
MTFVLAYGNLDMVGQVSDRRLTGSDGVLRVLPENKATVITLVDARLICGFAGLARSGDFRTGEWLLEAISTASSDTHLALDTVERFTDLATARFAQTDLASVPAASRGLSFLLTGYRDVPGPRAPLIAALVTNFQNFDTGEDEPAWDEFRATFWSVREDEAAPTYIQRIGQWPAMTLDDEARVRRALEQRQSPQALDTMTVGMVREIAARPLSGGTVGRELSSVQIGPVRPPGVDQGAVPMIGAFHPDGATHVHRGVNQVVSVRDDLHLTIRDPQISVAERQPDTVMAVQKVGRNKPCPCGSGRKYKLCHGA